MFSGVLKDGAPVHVLSAAYNPAQPQLQRQIHHVGCSTGHSTHNNDTVVELLLLLSLPQCFAVLIFFAVIMAVELAVTQALLLELCYCSCCCIPFAQIVAGIITAAAAVTML